MVMFLLFPVDDADCLASTTKPQPEGPEQELGSVSWETRLPYLRPALFYFEPDCSVVGYRGVCTTFAQFVGREPVWSKLKADSLPKLCACLHDC